MVDLSKFTGVCSYCYKDPSDTLAICFCGITLCLNHLELHNSKSKCEVYCVLSHDENEKIKVDELYDENDNKEEVAKKLNEKRDGSGQNYFKCPHFKPPSELLYLVDPKTARCDECGIDQNLWCCMECGYIGCGRKQEGCIGNGHALSHFNSTNNTDFTKKIHSSDDCIKKDHSYAESNVSSCVCDDYEIIESTSPVFQKDCEFEYINPKDIQPHHNSILVDTIYSQNQDIYCYTCDDFINQSLEFANSVLKEDYLKNLPKDLISVKSDILGIKNEGVTCYVSSALHLISEILAGIDLSEHFILCQSNPLECICCQFVKIVNEMKNATDTTKSIRIKDFLGCVYQTMGFAPGRQEDSAEFLMLLLDRLSFFEECQMIPKISDRLNCETETVLTCTQCNKTEFTKSKECMISCSLDKSLHEALSKRLDHEESSERVCECGGNIKEKVSLTKAPRYIIANVSRNSDGKADSPIEVGNVHLKLANRRIPLKYELVGCIYHSGNEVTGGHYTWWVNKKGSCFVVNDSIVSMSDLDYPKNGSIFLLKRITPSK